MGCKCGNANCALNASEAVYHCRSRAGVIRAGSHGRQGHRGGGPLPRAPTGQGASSALPGSSPWASGPCTRVGDRDPERALAGGGPGHPQGCPSHRACAEHAAGPWRCGSLSGPGLVSSPGSRSEAVKRGLLLQVPESDLSAGPSWPPGSCATLSRAPSSCVNADDNTSRGALLRPGTTPTLATGQSLNRKSAAADIPRRLQSTPSVPLSLTLGEVLPLAFGVPVEAMVSK